MTHLEALVTLALALYAQQNKKFPYVPDRVTPVHLTSCPSISLPFTRFHFRATVVSCRDRAYERFTGNQIAKEAKEHPAAYQVSV